MRRWRIELTWLGLVALLLLLGVWWIPGSGSVQTDTYSVTFTGKKGLYQSLRRLDGNVARSLNQLVPEFSENDRLLLLGPARAPTSQEWSALRLAVSNGMSLVFAVSDNDPVIDLEPFGVKIREPSMTATSAEFPASDSSAEKPSEKSDGGQKRQPPKPSIFDPPRSATTSLVSDPVTWRHPRPIVPSGSTESSLSDLGWETLVSVQDEPQVIRRQYGAGTVVVVNSDDIFTNYSMLDETQALLAIRILESAQTDGMTWFDETLNSSGTPKVFGILFDSQFRPLTLQLLLIAVLFGWSGARRFGPAAPPVDPPRRSIVEHAIALGGLYYRTRSAALVLTRWIEHFRHELHLAPQDRVARKEAEMLARWSGQNPHEVTELFDSVQRAMLDPKTSNATAAKRIRALAELKSQIISRLRRSQNAT